MKDFSQKIIIYQILPRLLNKNASNIPNGTLAENGCGKMAFFNRKVLLKIKRLGATHIWYTGLLEHATQTDYSSWGIAVDNKTVVKGKAGSPYAIKDYYDIDPDLAINPGNRMGEFEALLERTHQVGLKFIMDFVPNHVARQYHSDNLPDGVADLGENDDTSKAFSPQNNFYYMPEQYFCSPVTDETAPYVEFPARATGNNQFTSSPTRNDWYETIKLNYGIDYVHGGYSHFQPTPNTWSRMLEILLFWSGKGVDAFRCDMAEMVPVEFWNWAIRQVKKHFPNVIFIAEVYNPGLYYQYVNEGGFDYLYDKVGLYDTLRAVTCHRTSASAITSCWQRLGDLQSHMLNFLENHDEQRLASDFFAGTGRKGLAALVVSCCMNTNPFMIYGGQELGERGMDAEGFSGRDGRTSIFDYWSVSTLRRYFLEKDEENNVENAGLRDFYQKVLTLCNKEKAISEGKFFDLMYVNYDHPQTFNSERQYAFLRGASQNLILVCANFDNQPHITEIRIPSHAFEYLGISSGEYKTINLLTSEESIVNLLPNSMVRVSVEANSAIILKMKKLKKK